MKRFNKRGFTMIELIFVIVILGILSAVAVPKFLATQNAAKAQKIVSFVGTLNRTTLPSMYVSALQDDGSIKNMTLSDYIELPSEVTSLDISSCGSGSFAKIGSTSIGADIYCRDGNNSNMPKIAFTNDGNTSLGSSYFK